MSVIAKFAGDNVDGYIFDFVRNTEIRDYFRKHWQPRFCEKLLIIINSYTGIETKLEYMRRLLSGATGDDRKLCEEVLRYMEIGYNAIVNPKADVLYVTQHEYWEVSDEDKYGLPNMTAKPMAYHTSLADVVKCAEKHRGNDEKPDWEFYVDLIELPLKKENRDDRWSSYEQDWLFRMAFIDGKWTIRQLYRDYDLFEDWFKSHGISWDAFDIVDIYTEGIDHSFRLPFANGTKVKLQTPMMEEPIVGIIDTYNTGTEEYPYYFNYLCKEDSFPVEKSWDSVPEEERVAANHIILYQMPLPFENWYCVWDWIEKA